MRNHYYYGLDNDGNLLKYETQIPMLFVQDDDIYHTDKFSNTNFTDFVGDMEKSGITGASISVANSIISKIRTDSIELVRDFKANEKTISAAAIKSYLGLLEE